MSPLLPALMAALRFAEARETSESLDPGWMVDRWGREAGLPAAHVVGAALDSAGFLWLTTTEGLVSFDGARFRTWTTSDVPWLRTNRLVGIVPAPDGTLYVVDESGPVYRLDPSSRPLRGAVVMDEDRPDLFVVQGRVWAVNDRRAGTLDDGVFAEALRWEGDTQSRYSVGEAGVFVAQDDGKAAFVQSPGAIPFRLAADPARRELLPAASPDAAGWWLGPDGVRAGTGELLPAEEPILGRACGAWREPAGALRVGTTEGQWVERGGVMRRLPGAPDPTCEEGHVAGLGEWRVADGVLHLGGERVARLHARVQTVIADGTGGAWVAADDGLLHVRPAIARTLEPLPGRTWRSTDVVRSDGERLWIGSIAGELAKIEDDRLVVVPATPAVPEEGRLHTSLLRPLGDGTMSLFVANARAVLTAAGVVVPVAPPSGADPGPWLRAGGVDWLLRTDRLLHAAPGAAIGEETWTEARVARASVSQPRDVLALGGGTFLVVAAGALLHGPPADLRPVPSPSQDIRGARVDGDVLWLGTEDRGLCRLTPATDLSRAVAACAGEAAGLPRNVHATLEDAQGRLWLDGNAGIAVVDRRALTAVLDGEATTAPVLTLDTRDGLRDPEANGGQWSVERTADGRLWFPTMGGPVVVDPPRLAARSELAVRIESLRVDGVEAAGAGGMAPGRRELRVDWSVPEYVRPDQVEFRYRLDGVDTDWHAGDGTRSATWAGFPAGEHAVVVQARLGGEWGPERRVEASRRPTFVESRAFPASLVLGSMVSTAGIGVVLARRRRARVRELEAVVDRRTAELRERNAAVMDQAGRIQAQARRLAELDAARLQFVANLSHELRTPLMLVMSSLEEAGRAGPDALALARSNAGRMRELVDQLFDLVRLGSGRLPLYARRLELGPFLADLVRRHEPLARSRGLWVSFEEVAPAPTVWVDPDHLQKAVGNLLGNALKFTPAGGRVSVELAGDEQGARVRVRDDGPGVPAEVRDRIFDRFFQADGSATRAADGAGIGLALAREIADLHGGTLTLLDDDGPGATFELFLPAGTLHLAVGDIATTPSASPPPPTAVATPAPEGTVLLVEDHPELRAYLESRLAEEYRVEAVGDGLAALARLRAGGFALVLSDVMMPGIDGLSLCRAIREDPALAGLPVVLLSGSGATLSSEAYGAGATSYLAKPILASELLAALRDLLPPRSATLRPEGDEPGGPGEIGEAGDEAGADDAGAEERAPGGTPTAADRAFLQRALAVATAELHAVDFSPSTLATRLAMSPRTLHRRMVRAAGQSPVTWLQELRLVEARRRLQEGASVAEAAWAVGMNPAYFSRVYRAWFGHVPSQEGRA